MSATNTAAIERNTTWASLRAVGVPAEMLRRWLEVLTVTEDDDRPVRSRQVVGWAERGETS